MIVLDWTKPWSFVDQLEIWIKWIETWAKGDGNRELDVLRDEGKDKCTPALNFIGYSFLMNNSTISFPALYRTH